MATKLEQADLLDRAADEMLIRGRTRNSLEDRDGGVCVVGAICATEVGEIPNVFVDPTAVNEWFRHPVLKELAKTLGDDLPRGGFGVLPDDRPGLRVALWNDRDTTTDDEVFDLFRNTAKRLREEALQ